MPYDSPERDVIVFEAEMLMQWDLVTRKSYGHSYRGKTMQYGMNKIRL